VRSLALAYALAGADCIDVAADPAVIFAARDALQAAGRLAEAARQKGYLGSYPGGDLGGYAAQMPWLMISLNDGEDPHFRKAEFDPSTCPIDCPRPCETICPAQAIVFERASSVSGVIDHRCYGCGRCLPICPLGKITTRSHASSVTAVAPLLAEVEAIEIHTQVGRLANFERLWRTIKGYTHRLKLVAISCPDGDGLIDYLWALHDLIAPSLASCPRALIWQTDGRPMSGDIGDGATRAAVKLGQKVLDANLPGFVQLAGGTNRHTVEKLAAIGLLKGQHHRPGDRYIAGIAYGSYARVLLSPLLDKLEAGESARSPVLEEVPMLLWQAVELADSLVSPLKAPMKLKQTIPK
jgi:Fe-S-cluster-containing hydrogenase component 2